MAPTEPSVYGGTAEQVYNSNLLAHTAVEYMPTFRQVVVDAQPLLKALGIAAFGKANAVDHGSFGGDPGKRSSTGKGIVFHDGGPQFEFPLLTTAPSGSVIGRLGNVNPTHNQPAKTGAYAYIRLVWSIMVPEEFVKDNKGNARLMNRLDNEMKLAQMAAARDVNYIMAGSSSAPTGATTLGLNYLVSYSGVTIGGLSDSDNTWWANQSKACTSIGGGGELDRPLKFLRSLESLMMTIREKGGSSDNQLLVATRGAFQYYRRAAYADTTATGNPGTRKAEYDAAGLDHAMFMACPMIYDSNIQVPYGGTASRDAVYTTDLSELGAHFKRDEFFDVEGWAAPTVKDKQRFYQMNIWARMIPAVTNRRIQGVMYNIPLNPDAS